MRFAAVLVVGALAVSACGSSSPSSSGNGAKGTVVIGDSTTLSGSIAQLGQTGLNGVEMAVAAINQSGGLLGKDVKIVSADDAATPSTGVSEVRDMITSQHAVAIFGPVSSAVAAAQEQVTNEFKIPAFFYVSNDIHLMRGGPNKYAFQFVPNTIMEPSAVADYFAKKAAGQQITIATIAPNYSFGQDTVAGFISALNSLDVNYKLVAQEFPPLSATDITAYLTAIVNAHPEYVFNAQFGGDLVNFTHQADSFGLFQQTKLIAMYGYTELQELGSSAPAGSIGFDRAPFWAIPQAASFTSAYKAKYGNYPSAWALMGYTAVQGWAWAVKKANSFSAPAVSSALAGATVPTIRGNITIQACDHQAEIPEYVGTISSQPSQYNGVRLYDSTFSAPFSDINPPCSAGA